MMKARRRKSAPYERYLTLRLKCFDYREDRNNDPTYNHEPLDKSQPQCMPRISPPPVDDHSKQQPHGCYEKPIPMVQLHRLTPSYELRRGLAGKNISIQLVPYEKIL